MSGGIAFGTLPRPRMNRSIALFVALAVLVAHSFAIHVDANGAFAPPYDAAYVAFRLGRSLAHLGELVWNQGSPGFDSHPSILWVGLCALSERLYLSINAYCQYIGMGCAMMTVLLTSRFHPDRIASLIAPLLLAVSGGLAAAAVSGTETTALAMFLTAAFLAFELGDGRALGVALLLAGLTRPEAWILGGALFLLRLRELAILRSRGASSARLRAQLRPFLVPLAGFAAVTIWRWSSTGRGVSSYGADLLSVRPGELAAGLGYVADFFVTSGSPALIAFGVWFLARGRFSGTGIRALVLFALWTALVVLNGGGPPIFQAAMVPALPLALIAAQEGMITALNSPRRAVRSVAWSGFLLAIAVSAHSSIRPGDIGPLPVAELRARWSVPSFPPRFGYEDRLGRAGLEEEIATTSRLRAVGIFMRDELDPDRSVLTPWPGAIAYLSRLETHDLLGRADPIAPGSPTRSWADRERVDVLASCARRADFVVPFGHGSERIPSPEELAQDWMAALDVEPEDEARAAELARLLEEYELVTVPIELGIPSTSAEPDMHLLLRLRELGLGPELALRREGHEFVVEMRHAGHLELADLRVHGTDARGRTWYLEPTGSFRENRALLARTYLLIHPTGDRSVELVRATLPRDEPELVELTAVLRTPKASEEHAWSFASEAVVLDLR